MFKEVSGNYSKACAPVRKEKDILQHMIDCAKNINLVYLDPDFNFVRVNQAYADTCGYKPEEMVGKNHFAIYPHEENQAIFKRVRDTGVAAQYHDKPFTFPDQPERGITFWDWTLEPVKDNSGNVTGLIFSLVETTERKKAEEAIRRSQEKESDRRKELEVLMETTPALIWFAHDPKCLSMTGNKAMYDMLRLPYGVNVSETAPERKNPNFLAYFNDKPIDPNDLPMQEAVRTGKPVFGSEFELRFADGRRVWVYGNTAPLFSDSGQVMGAIGVFIDITERKKAEAALKDSEELFSSAFHSISFPVSLVRLSDNQFVDVNDAFIQMIGYSQQEIVGHTSKEFDMFPNYDERQEYVRLLLKQGCVSNKEIDVQTKAGKVRRVLFSVKLITISGKKHLLSSLIDVTEQRRLEKEVQIYTKDLELLVEQRTKELKEAERLAAIGTTAGMVGHDIRNPLQAIVGDLYFAKQEIKDIPEDNSKKAVEESLDAIEENIFYINKIVADLQDYARPLQPQLQESNLKSIIEQTLHNQGIPKNVEVSYRIDKGVHTVLADSDFLKRIISNLSLNAVQAMPKGGQLMIHAFKDKETNDTIIIVKDNGVGIPDDVKEKIFTPMFTTKCKGQGFGLPVVKRLVEGLGGSVTFESQVNKGTTFTVRLPL